MKTLLKASFWPFLILCAYFFVRNDGIHIDESSYLGLAKYSFLHDSRINGKPFLWYLLNAGLYHGLGTLVYPWRPLFLSLFYIFLWSFSTVVLSRALFEDKGSRVRFVALFCGLPFFAFNVTQLMMETGLLCFLNLFFAYCLRTSQVESRREFGRLFALALVGVWLKITLLPVLLILIFFVREKRMFSLLAVGLGSFVAILGNKLSLILIGALPHKYDISLLELFETPALLERQLEGFTAWIQLWNGFVPGVLVVFAAIILLQGFGKRGLGGRDGFRLSPQACLAYFVLAYLMVIGIMFINRQQFARYAYPAIWMGLLPLCCLGARGLDAFAPRLTSFFRNLPVICVLLSVLTMHLSLFSPGEARMKNWPELVRRERLNNAGTVLLGVRMHLWTFLNPIDRFSPCVFVNSKGESARHITKYLDLVLFSEKVFDETNLDGWNRCEGARLAFDRRHEATLESCHNLCTAIGATSTHSEFQYVDFFQQKTGTVLNCSCLPY